jgi:DNA-binding transcriptional regulator YiaG
MNAAQMPGPWGTIMAHETRKPFFERLKEGLKESIAHARGELPLKTTVVPAAPPEIDARTIVAMRQAANMSQTVFASVLFVSAKTVQSWEQGVRVPSMAARRLIHIFAEQPATVCQVVGLPAVQLPGIKVVSAGNGKRRIVMESRKAK